LISFDCEALKKTRMNPAHVAKNQASAFSLRRPHPPASASRSEGHRNPVHGNSPGIRIRMKK